MAYTAFIDPRTLDDGFDSKAQTKWLQNTANSFLAFINKRICEEFPS